MTMLAMLALALLAPVGALLVRFVLCPAIWLVSYCVTYVVVGGFQLARLGVRRLRVR